MVRSEVEKAARIAGGFVRVPVSSLMAAWSACRSEPLGVGDFRAWLACREMVARRAGPSGGHGASYGAGELAALLQVSQKRARACLRRLEAAGLISRADGGLAFPEPAGDAPGLEETIGRGRGSVIIPRRMLRFLCRGGRPALIATALGVLLRCLSRRKGGFGGRGRVKASWVAGTFHLSLRQVQAARRELVEVGWIAPEEADQWALNRWGRAYRVRLDWSAPRPAGGPTSSYPRPAGGPDSAQPCLHPEPLPEKKKDQEPGEAGPTGARLAGAGGIEDPPTTIDPPTARRSDLATSPPEPRLEDVRVEDLEDSARLLELRGQAEARGLVGPSEADRLRFFAAAEHALAVGKANPAGLFAYLVRRGCWRYSTQADERRANARIKAWLRGEGRPPGDSGSPPPMIHPLSRDVGQPGLSADARIVKAVREAAIRAGIFRDPYPAFRSRYPEWDPARWAAAMTELGLG